MEKNSEVPRIRNCWKVFSFGPVLHCCLATLVFPKWMNRHLPYLLIYGPYFRPHRTCQANDVDQSMINVPHSISRIRDLRLNTKLVRITSDLLCRTDGRCRAADAEADFQIPDALCVTVALVLKTLHAGLQLARPRTRPVGVS